MNMLWQHFHCVVLTKYNFFFRENYMQQMIFNVHSSLYNFIKKFNIPALLQNYIGI